MLCMAPDVFESTASPFAQYRERLYGRTGSGLIVQSVVVMLNFVVNDRRGRIFFPTAAALL